MYRENEQYQDAYNMYLAANKSLYNSRDSYNKARACEGVAYSSLQLGDINSAYTYIHTTFWDEFLLKPSPDTDLVFVSKCLITTCLIFEALGEREPSHMYYDLAFNIITNLFRENRLDNYDLLIDLYFRSGDAYSTLEMNGQNYKDWAAAYYSQIVYLYGKCERRGEFINLHKYVHALEKLIKMRKCLGVNNNLKYEEKLMDIRRKLIVI